MLRSFFIISIILTCSYSFASDSDNIVEPVTNEQPVLAQPNAVQSTIDFETDKTGNDRFQKKQIKRKNKILKRFRKKLRNKASGSPMIFLSLLLLVTGMLYAGIAGWVIILSIIGLIVYAGLLAFIIYKLVHKEFKKPFIAWLLLSLMIYSGIAGLLLLIGITPIGLALGYALLYLMMGAIGITAAMILAYALFKSTFALFRKLRRN